MTSGINNTEHASVRVLCQHTEKKMAEALGLFAKYWQPGKVKTRLASSLGPERAASIYREFVFSMLSRLSVAADERVLAFSPEDRVDDFAEPTFACWPKSWRLEPQSDGDLGTRMKNFFAKRFAEGYEQVVLLGTDSPNVPVDYVAQALRELQSHDVVLGPSEDGGYYLVGARRQVPAIFEGIPWSTPKVWQVTTDALRLAGNSFATLPPWYDVDERADYERLIVELANSKDSKLQELHDRLMEL